MPTDLARLSATAARRRLGAREVSVVDLVTASLDAVTAGDERIRAWVHIDREGSLARARALDADVASGRALGSLGGVPVGVKDIFNTIGMPTQMGSPIWSGFTPGNDARVVYGLRMADAVVIGKTVTAEFAVHAPGTTRNPHNPAYMPGTSSSGSAAAVAAHMVPVALGTQTGGSIIRPASYCGVYGMKPSFGLVPRTGMLKTTDSLDTVGWFARCPEDLRLVFEVARVRGADYPISDAALSDPARQIRGARPWRVALVRGPKWMDAEGYARQALTDLGASARGAGAAFAVDELALPAEFDQAHAIHAAIYDKTLAYYFRDEFKKKTLISPVMYEIIERGNRISLDAYKAALAAQSVLARRLDDLFAGGVDALLTLATGGEALEGLASSDRPDSCLIWTLCGAASVSAPVFTGPHALPFGAQFVARRFNDYLLLSLLDELAAARLIPTDTHPALA